MAIHPLEEGPAEYAEGMNNPAPEHHLQPLCDKGPLSLTSFYSPSYFPAKDSSLDCVLLHIPVLSFPPALPLILRTFQIFCPVLLLLKSSWACPLKVPPPVYFHTFLYPFLSYTSFSSPVLSFPPSLPICWSSTSLPKIFLSMPAGVPSSSVLFLPLPFPIPSHTFCNVDLTLTFFYCNCNAFFFTFCFLGIFLKNLL